MFQSRVDCGLKSRWTFFFVAHLPRSSLKRKPVQLGLSNVLRNIFSYTLTPFISPTIESTLKASFFIVGSFFKHITKNTFILQTVTMDPPQHRHESPSGIQRISPVHSYQQRNGNPSRGLRVENRYMQGMNTNIRHTSAFKPSPSYGNSVAAVAASTTKATAAAKVRVLISCCIIVILLATQFIVRII